MNYKSVPKKLLKTKFRKEMWRNVRNMIEQIEKSLPISHAYVMGSFATKKDRPADIDFIIPLQSKEKRKNAKWSVDLVIAPDNKYGRWGKKDTDKWMKDKYGLKKSALVELK